ncbi:MAG: beta-lactamase family protein [Oscillospiraceae bacterium]|nr:beta-lactamase family protein [Oscillospiraceae bacterium]
MNNYKEIMRSECEDNRFTAGVNMLVLQNGKELIYEDFGYRDMENKVPFSRDTIMRLYSMTKPITAAAVMILADRGLLDISNCLCWFFPGFKPAYTYKDGKRVKTQNEIMVKDLLNMTSGIPYPGEGIAEQQVSEVFWELGQRLTGDNPMTTMEFAGRIAQCDLSFDPGEKFMYGSSADILGAVVELISGMRFGEFLEKEIFEPLGMTDTGFWVPPEKQPRLSKIYRTNYEKWCIEEEDKDRNHLGIRYSMVRPPEFESGGAGLCSTLDDYAKFATMLLNGGEYNGHRILSKAAVKYMTSASLMPWQQKDLSEHWKGLQGFSYGNLMRNCVDPGQALIFAEKGEYGWDGWLGPYFSNSPESGLTILIGMQRVDCGTCGMTRKLINAVRSDLDL